MDRIHYAGGELLTGSAIADAIVDYAAALASRRSAASIDIPIRAGDGSTARAHLLIGPASQLLTEPVETDLDELVDEDLVSRLRAATTALSSIRPVVGESEDGSDDGDTDDLEWPPIR
ncbi:hypothetical protein [Agromyces bracchium]|uniref:Uncharacterized protein n=1 Tax=Agromyces bracchium TaxID=88376 RepID=A0A6I3MJ42_9MICO|nr:hypothetical protein [Agromyces bracchium]MTH70263.1 hypothetical protein [Agromyces bracchium]